MGNQLTGSGESSPTLTIPAKNGMRTLHVLYLFSGTDRKATICRYVRELCEKEGFGLEFWVVDTLIDGKAHDLLDKDSQQWCIDKIESGDFDVQFLSAPCGTWSRATFANDSGPQPCRDRKHPWGKPNMVRQQQVRAEKGNEFVHFCIRAIVAAQTAKSRGVRVMSLWEHPEDLGMTHRGGPASV